MNNLTSSKTEMVSTGSKLLKNMVSLTREHLFSTYYKGYPNSEANTHCNRHDSAQNSIPQAGAAIGNCQYIQTMEHSVARQRSIRLAMLMG
jgi:hypothetical protein